MLLGGYCRGVYEPASRAAYSTAGERYFAYTSTGSVPFTISRTGAVAFTPIAYNRSISSSVRL